MSAATPAQAARQYRIAVLPGDGIGPEVIAQALQVLQAGAAGFGYALASESFPWGSDYYCATGRMMPEDALTILSRFDAILLGAVGDTRIPDSITLGGMLLPIRRGFDQYACVRPVRTFPGVRSPLVHQPVVDLVVVRENTEGEYAHAGGTVYHGTDGEVAVQTAIFTRRGTERILRYAFDLARSRRRKLTSITKSNALGYSMVFWDRVFQAVARGYPEVETESLLVDAACLHLVRRPDTFDVLVASNLFGDIISDLAPAVTGSLGLAASANLNPERRHPSMFEPVHGSAPDIAGQQVANPAAAVLSAAMMLRFLGETAAAAAIESAVAGVLDTGPTTRDLGGTATTSEVGAAIADRLTVTNS